MARAEQLARDISDRIESGDLAPGEQLPTMAEMSRSTGIPGTTVQTAYRILRDRGIIRTVHGQGTFVATPKPMFTRDATTRYVEEKQRAGAQDPETMAVMVAEMDSPGLNRDQIQVEAAFVQVEADGDQAEQFGIEPGAMLLERIYRTRVGDPQILMSVVDSFIPMALVEGNPDLLDQTKEPWPGGTIHQLSTVGIEVASISDRVIARPPTPQEAQGMQLDAGVVLLEITKTSIDTDGRVVEVSVGLFPSDRTALAYTVDLPRWTT